MVISMKRDDVVSIKGGLRSGLGSVLGSSQADVTVRCVDGAVWVTVAGDHADHILSPGKELTVSRKGKIVIMADTSSSVRLSRPVVIGALTRLGRKVPPESGVWPVEQY